MVKRIKNLEPNDSIVYTRMDGIRADHQLHAYQLLQEVEQDLNMIAIDNWKE